MNKKIGLVWLAGNKPLGDQLRDADIQLFFSRPRKARWLLEKTGEVLWIPNRAGYGYYCDVPVRCAKQLKIKPGQCIKFELIRHKKRV